ncbi:MAG TPA: radical SAM protein [Candidatus Sumerlaeota bacterium]|nr:radical SAM protein [Candidatus Sumerlaeota bacterium]
MALETRHDLLHPPLTEPAAELPTHGATLLVNELYASIQGESTHAGRPCGFIRLTGCPLRCVWCDSAFAFQGGERLEIAEILRRVADFGLPLVEVTGGEPLAQPNCLPLLRALCDAGHEVLLETGGSCDVAPVDPRVGIVLDIKCPGSGESHANHWENLTRLRPRDELKFVLLDRADYEWARRLIHQYRLAGTRPIHFSPVHGALAPAALAAWIIADRLDVRLHLQLHKQIWPGRTHGV